MISCDVVRDVAILTIDRAQKANALPTTGKSEMADRLAEMASNDDIRAMVVNGRGNRHFCAGSDVQEFVNLDRDSMLRMLRAEQAMYRAALSSPKPVVAAVNGAALGTGLLLVIVCDYAVASTSARFGVPELSIGASTPIEGLLLPWVVGLGWARAMYYSGRHLLAEEAAQLGLVHEITSPEECLERAVEIAAQIAAAPRAFALQKRWMYELVTSGDLEGVIERSVAEGVDQLLSGETADAMRRFLSRPR